MARSVLIVDDHPGFRAQARALLVAAGYEVVGEAADGESGVRVARDLSPDVVTGGDCSQCGLPALST
jgi:DNA-binding NarL/FixJ family response regulator